MRVRYLVALSFGTLILAVVATPSAHACWWCHQRPYYPPTYYDAPVVVVPPTAAAPRPLPVAGGSNEQLIQRGKYLVHEVAHCTHCHTPQTGGKPDESKLLRGATLPIKPKDPKAEWADMSPDITRSGLAGKLGEEGIVKFLMTGKDPKGNAPKPPMPVYHMKEDDARAVARYLLSVGGDAKGNR